MRLFSYVVARDYGFAPNPFLGICTLATCKPDIRKAASIGDWVIGTGSSSNHRRGHLVYAMCVTGSMTFNDYWRAREFQGKKPNLRGSVKQAFGDNIYFKDNDSQWRQMDSHHSYPNGVPNRHNILHDTQVDRILISQDYAYWGESGLEIPSRFRDYKGDDICASRGHKCRFPSGLVDDFVFWFRSLKAKGFLDKPQNWSRST